MSQETQPLSKSDLGSLQPGVCSLKLAITLTFNQNVKGNVTNIQTFCWKNVRILCTAAKDSKKNSIKK